MFSMLLSIQFCEAASLVCARLVSGHILAPYYVTAGKTHD